VPAVVLAALLLTALLPVWLPLAALVDLLRGRWRCPTARLLGVALCWSWLETAGVTVAGVLWLSGRSGDLGPHYWLQRWWALWLIRALRVICGIKVSVEGGDGIGRGPFVALCRHASLADSLVSAWAFGSVLGLDPRYVLKRELSLDPCLDIVGNRLPNYFVDRSAVDTSAELAGIARMTEGMGEGGVAVIFPEGTRASAKKRASIMRRMSERDPERAARLGALRHLIPPQVSGAESLVTAVPAADVLLVWHVGFDGLDTFGGMLRALDGALVPARFVIERHPRATVPTGAGLGPWLDQKWLEMDAKVADALGNTVAAGGGSPERGE